MLKIKSRFVQENRVILIQQVTDRAEILQARNLAGQQFSQIIWPLTFSFSSWRISFLTRKLSTFVKYNGASKLEALIKKNGADGHSDLAPIFTKLVYYKLFAVWLTYQI